MVKILMVGQLENKKIPLAFDFLKSLNSNYEIDVYGSGSEYSNLKLYRLKITKINF